MISTANLGYNFAANFDVLLRDFTVPTLTYLVHRATETVPVTEISNVLCTHENIVFYILVI